MSSFDKSTTEGLITIYKLGPVTLHTYTSPDTTALVNTHIVETANELHIIDAQFLQNYAAEARAYADSLNKPIRRLYLTHSHPDHLFGATKFDDVEFVTSKGVMTEINTLGDIYKARKEAIKDTTAIRMPSDSLTLGATTWDGLEVNIDEVENCEAASALTFHIPEAGLFLAGDIFYANVHAYPTGTFDNWIPALEKIRDTEGLQLIAAGHGLPSTAGGVDNAIAYLRDQKKVVSNSADADSAIAALTKAYPSYGGKDILAFIGYIMK